MPDFPPILKIILTEQKAFIQSVSKVIFSSHFLFKLQLQTLQILM